MISKDTINIAIWAIKEWRDTIEREQTFTEIQQFNSDTKQALLELREELEKE